ncbi:uncharacterized protein cfap97d2 [Limanda limanda]|uniref:uncharacterized protein cfap97d2 n=1 Tax=Limanda limanda TaxID=27771 RepID=UPI0029C61094|nr:uncharacterized protein cfap97d2 [Limanda limanda]
MYDWQKTDRRHIAPVDLEVLEHEHTGQMRSCDIETPGAATGCKVSQRCTQRTKMQHLAHPSPFPTGSQFLQQKIEKASYDLHKRKVKSAESTINTSPPKTYGHLDLKLKKQKLEEKRILRIQQENNMLMERISHIMRTTGGVDNRNDYDKKSLGKEKRQLESLRITEENQMILHRLSQCRPHYNVRSWHDDWLKTLKLMDSIAHYPRGRAKLQKGQDKPDKGSSGWDKGQIISTGATTHSPASNNTKAKTTSGGSEMKTGTSETQDTGTENQQDTNTHPDPESPRSSQAV